MFHVHRQIVVVDNLILWRKGHESATTLHMYETLNAEVENVD